MTITTKSLFARWVLVAFLCLGASQAQAQFQLTRFKDVPAPGGSSIKTNNHSGTDSLTTDAGDWLHVMTWDVRNTNRVMLGWALNSSPVSHLVVAPPNGGFDIYDPDVTISRRNGEIYAALVYIATDSTNAWPRAYLESFKWDASSKKFNPVRSPNAIPLGHLGIPGLPRTHKHPNIDADNDGALAVAWQEEMLEKLTFTVTSSYFGTITEELVIDFSDVYVFVGTVDGNRDEAYCGYAEIPAMAPTASVPYRGHLVRAPTRTNRPSLFEQAAQPDVTITGDMVSVAYIRRYYSEPRLFNSQVNTSLAVYQFRYSRECPRIVPVEHHEWPGGVSTPRITGGPYVDSSKAPDVEIAAWAASGVNCPGDKPWWRIYNYGKRGGVFDAHVTDVTDGVSSELASELPAISYFGEEGGYVIAWTGTNYPTVGSGKDVWYRTLKGGDLTSDFIRLNLGDYKSNKGTGAQLNVSVGGRWMRDVDGAQLAGFLFFDQTDYQEYFKLLALPE